MSAPFPKFAPADPVDAARLALELVQADAEAAKPNPNAYLPKGERMKIYNASRNSKIDALEEDALTESASLAKFPLLVELLQLENVCIAGSFPMITELQGKVDWLKCADEGDIDFWVYQPGFPHLNRANVALFVDVLRKHDPEVVCTKGRGSSVLNFKVRQLQRTIQVILIDAASAWEIVRKFDLSPCKAFYEWNKEHQRVELGTTKDSRESWRTRDVMSMGQDYEGHSISPARIAKLESRGFLVNIPPEYDPRPITSDGYVQCQTEGDYPKEPDRTDAPAFMGADIDVLVDDMSVFTKISSGQSKLWNECYYGQATMA